MSVQLSVSVDKPAVESGLVPVDPTSDQLAEWWWLNAIPELERCV